MEHDHARKLSSEETNLLHNALKDLSTDLQKLSLELEMAAHEIEEAEASKLQPMVVNIIAKIKLKLQESL